MAKRQLATFLVEWAFSKLNDRPAICKATTIKIICLSIFNRNVTLISNSNWIEWSTIQGVIAHGWFEITSLITPELYNTQSNYYY